MKKVKEIFKVLFEILIVIAIVVALIFGTGMMGVTFTKTISAKLIDAQRVVFENSKSYVKGSSRDIADLMFQYNTTDSQDEKSAILETVRNRYSDFDANKLDNGELRNWLKDVQTGMLK